MVIFLIFLYWFWNKYSIDHFSRDFWLLRLKETVYLCMGSITLYFCKTIHCYIVIGFCVIFTFHLNISLLIYTNWPSSNPLLVLPLKPVSYYKLNVQFSIFFSASTSFSWFFIFLWPKILIKFCKICPEITPFNPFEFFVNMFFFPIDLSFTIKCRCFYILHFIPHLFYTTLMKNGSTL